ncbi:MAG: hypothetical protein QOC54_1486, partial [Baekduia sp.]|nr:hypothetical protein [Baekduia sp.]
TSVTLFGRPVFHPALAHEEAAAHPGAHGGGSIFESQYLTPNMRVPLLYRNEPPYARYAAEFVVDIDQQITETIETNNQWAWPPPGFWFATSAMSASKEPIVIEHGVAVPA